MDYNGNLSDCDLLIILVESRDELEKRIIRLSEFYPDNASALQAILKKSTNDKRHFRKEVKLPVVDEEIILSLT